MENENNDFLGTESIGKLLFKLALPSVTAQLINMLYNIVDRVYIGHIPGTGALAPVSYTHLDVYKRQASRGGSGEGGRFLRDSNRRLYFWA